jgi:hypothetical protein
MTWKQFLSVDHFKELKVIFFLEIIILVLLMGIVQDPGIQKLILKLDLQIFNPFAFVISIVTWVISSYLDKERYFNLATLILNLTFLYGCYWSMFELMSSL